MEDQQEYTLLNDEGSSGSLAVLRREIRHREEQILKNHIVLYWNKTLTAEHAHLMVAEIAGLRSLSNDLERQTSKALKRELSLTDLNN